MQLGMEEGGGYTGFKGLRSNVITVSRKKALRKT